MTGHASMGRSLRRLVRAAIGLAALALVLSPAWARAAPEAELWPRWAAHDPASNRVLDHTAWNRFLAAYVAGDQEGVNRVAYGRVSARDRAILESYIQGLQAVPVSRLNRAEQLAFWINLYNAATVRVILDRYPVESIRDIRISPGLFSVGPWGRKLVTVEGEELSLDDIEHRILRPIWRDPRIHYAVNCAAVGCPNLATTAYTGAQVDDMLTAAARAYINSPRGARLEPEGLVVSSIYDWYEEDFGGSGAGVLDHLREYAAPTLARRLEGVRRIAGYRYDWSLNDARAAVPEKAD